MKTREVEARESHDEAGLVTSFLDLARPLLSDRELKVLGLSSEGRTTAEICKANRPERRGRSSNAHYR